MSYEKMRKGSLNTGAGQSGAGMLNYHLKLMIAGRGWQQDAPPMPQMFGNGRKNH